MGPPPTPPSTGKRPTPRSLVGYTASPTPSPLTLSSSTERVPNVIRVKSELPSPPSTPAFSRIKTEPLDREPTPRPLRPNSKRRSRTPGPPKLPPFKARTPRNTERLPSTPFHPGSKRSTSGSSSRVTTATPHRQSRTPSAAPFRGATHPSRSNSRVPRASSKTSSSSFRRRLSTAASDTRLSETPVPRLSVGPGMSRRDAIDIDTSPPPSPSPAPRQREDTASSFDHGHGPYQRGLSQISQATDGQSLFFGDEEQEAVLDSDDEEVQPPKSRKKARDDRPRRDPQALAIEPPPIPETFDRAMVEAAEFMRGLMLQQVNHQELVTNETQRDDLMTRMFQVMFGQEGQERVDFQASVVENLDLQHPNAVHTLLDILFNCSRRMVAFRMNVLAGSSENHKVRRRQSAWMHDDFRKPLDVLADVIWNKVSKQEGEKVVRRLVALWMQRAASIVECLTEMELVGISEDLVYRLIQVTGRLGESIVSEIWFSRN